MGQTSEVQLGNVQVGVWSLGLRLLKTLCSWSCLYLWGYFQCSPGWLLAPLLFSVLKYEWKKEKKASRLNAQLRATTDEKQFLVSRLQDLPAWVYFPDFERVEWLNRVVNQLWPSIGHFVTHYLTTEVESLIKGNLEGTRFKDFKFEHLTFGSIPPRLGGIKCYRQARTARDEIVLDIDLSWAGDSASVVSLSGMKASILDLYIAGNLRLVLKPLIHSLPLVGGVQFYFLNNPKVDFAVGGVANVADLPLISTLIRRIIMEQLARFVVLPNRISIPLATDIPLKVFKCPEPRGILRVTVVEASNLMAKDLSLFGAASSDPYCCLSIGARQYKTVVVKKSLDPVWDETWESIVEVVKGQNLNLELWDFNVGTSDDFLGRATIPMGVLVGRGSSDMWVSLEEATSGRVRLKTQWLYLSQEMADYNESIREVQHLHLCTSVLQVYVDSCRQLPLGKTSRPDPIVQVSVASSSSPQETKSIRYSRNPIYEEGFIFLVKNPEVDDLHVVVYDEKTKATLGQLKIPLASLMRRSGMEYFNQPFKLKNSGHESSITLHLKLHYTKKAQPKKKYSQCSESRNFEQAHQEEHDDNDAIDMSDVEEKIEDHDDISGGSVESLPQPELRNRLTRRAKRELTPPPSSPEPSVASIQLSVDYNNQEEKLTVIIHRAVNLPAEEHCWSAEGDPYEYHRTSLPDPYVRMVLLPDRPRRRKTTYVADSLHPAWEETFAFRVPSQGLHDKELELLVMDRKGLFSRAAEIGRLILRLTREEIGKEQPQWHHIALTE